MPRGKIILFDSHFIASKPGAAIILQNNSQHDHKIRRNFWAWSKQESWAGILCGFINCTIDVQIFTKAVSHYFSFSILCLPRLYSVGTYYRDLNKFNDGSV